jgi:hypothetical protein
MAGKANFSVVRGDTFNRSCTFRNKTSGVPVNITGSIISGKVNGTIDLDVVIISGVNGQFTFGLHADVTALLPVGVNSIEVQIQFPSLEVKTLFYGNLVVKAQTA